VWCTKAISTSPYSGETLGLAAPHWAREMMVGTPLAWAAAPVARGSVSGPATTMWARRPCTWPFTRIWKARAPPIQAGSVPFIVAPSGPWSPPAGRASQRLHRPRWCTRTSTCTWLPRLQRAPITSKERAAVTGLPVTQPRAEAEASGSATAAVKCSGSVCPKTAVGASAVRARASPAPPSRA
jgi:hypothetical protein